MKKDKIVFTFGRFNPPTTGHYLLASKVKQEAIRRGADHRIYASSTKDNKRNPLIPRQKLGFMKKILRGFNVIVNSKTNNPFAALKQLSKEGYKDVVMVVGADRTDEFRKAVPKYIGKEYNFKSFEVVSAGERDPDSDKIEGMSATKMRNAAKEGNLNAFMLGIPSHVNKQDIKTLFTAVQKGMGVKPFITESWFDYDEFVEFLSEDSSPEIENIMKNFNLSGEGVHIPATDNEMWGTEGFKKKKRKIKRISERWNDNLNEKTKAAKLIKSASGFVLLTLDDKHIKRGSSRKELLTHAKNQNIKVHDTTNESVELDEDELNEISLQARRKMGRAAKRTAKKRMRTRKIKEKRKKNPAEIKKKAQKEAMKKVRGKFIKGRKWSEISFAQREKIEQMLKKKKGKISKLAKRLLPAMNKAEQERLRKVKNKMTSNDPAKAVESIDLNFNTFLSEQSPRWEMSKQKAIARERERGLGASSPQERDAARKRGERSVKEKTGSSIDWKDVAIVRGKNDGTIKIVRKPTTNHEIVIQKGRVKTSDGKRALNGKYGDFKSTKTSEMLLGMEKSSSLEKKAEKQKRRADNAEQQLQQTDTETQQQQQMNAEDEVSQQQTEYDKNMITALDKIKNKKPCKGCKYPIDYQAVDIEVGFVDAFNNQYGVDPALGEISSKDLNKLKGSLTLSTAGNRVVDTILKEIDPNREGGWRAIHYGRATDQLSEFWVSGGGSNATPKTDVYLERENPETKELEQIRISIKAGEGQLLSARKGEAISTMKAVLSRLSVCPEGVPKKDCKSKLSNEKDTVKKLKNIIDKMERGFASISTGIGVGPIGWYTKNSYSGKKPPWWDKTGPGSKGIEWEEVAGTPPLPEHFENTPSGYKKSTIELIKKSQQFHETLTEELSKLLSESKLVKRILTHEAMTGCVKFCGCCENDCGCQQAVPTHLLTMNPDGTEAKLHEINDDFVDTVAEKTTYRYAFKSASEKSKSNLEKYGIKKAGSQGGASTLRGLQQSTVESFLGYSGSLLLEENNNFSTEMENIKKLAKDPIQIIEYFDLLDRLENIESDEMNFGGELSSEYSGEYTVVKIDGNVKKIPIEKNQKEDEDNENNYLADFEGNIDEDFQVFINEAVVDRQGRIRRNIAPGSFITGKGGGRYDVSKGDADFRQPSISGIVHPTGLGLPHKATKHYTIRPDFLSRVTTNPKRAKPDLRKKILTVDRNSQAIMNYIRKKALRRQPYGGRSQRPLRESYMFGESSIHGTGTFSAKNIQEGEKVGLYYINLLNENTPEYQRTDFCRLVNHSHHNANLILKEQDGNFYAIASKKINEEEEILIDYFHVFETIFPKIQPNGKVIEEVLRWTAGYNHIEFDEDNFNDLTEELRYFVEIGDCPCNKKEIEYLDCSEKEDPINRAKRLKKYNAQPKQRKRRSARTNKRNQLIRDGILKVGDGQDVDHIDGNPLNNSPSNIKTTSASNNRGRNNNKWRNEEHGAGEVGTDKLLKRYIKDTPYMTTTKGK